MAALGRFEGTGSLCPSSHSDHMKSSQFPAPASLPTINGLLRTGGQVCLAGAQAVTLSPVTPVQDFWKH